MVAGTPANQSVLYAQTPFRIFRSDDGGDTWRLRHDFVDEGRFPDIHDLIVDPQLANTAYALTRENTVLRTLDGGETWSQVGATAPGILALAFDARVPGVLYGAAFDGLYSSIDRGRHWSRAGFEGRLVAAFAIDAHDPDLFYSAETTGEFGETTQIWTSRDHGVSWTAVLSVQNHSSWESPQPRFVSDRARAGVAYFFFPGSYAVDDVYRTADGGSSWTRRTLTSYLSDIVTSSSGALLVATYLGISRSADFGETFDPPLVGETFSPREQFSRLWVSSSGTLVGAGTQGIWRSNDDGAHWSEANQGLSALDIVAVAVAPTGPETAVAIAGRGVFRSADQGASWRKMWTDLESPNLSLWSLQALDPRFPKTMYAIGSLEFLDAYDGLARTKDGGRTWVDLPFPFGSCGGSICELELSAFALDPKHPERMYLGGFYFFHLAGRGNFLLRSDDGFQTSTALQPLVSPYKLAIDPDDGTMLGLTCRRLYRSENGAKSWRRVGLGLPTKLCSYAPHLPAAVLTLGTGRPRRLYVGTAGLGVYVSTNLGATFSPMNKGLEAAVISVIVADPADSSKLYAGVYGRGVFSWNARLRTWVALGEGLPVANFSGQLAIDPRHPDVLFAGTDEGLFRIDLATTP